MWVFYKTGYFELSVIRTNHCVKEKVYIYNGLYLGFIFRAMVCLCICNFAGLGLLAYIKFYSVFERITMFKVVSIA